MNAEVNPNAKHVAGSVHCCVGDCHENLAALAQQSDKGHVAEFNDLRTQTFPVLDLRAFGLVGDTLQLTTCDLASGSKNVHCASANFSASTDVGKGLWFLGVGASSGYLNTRITAVTDSTHVVVNDAAATAVASGGTLWYGTDNTAAWCKAMQCTVATPPNKLYTAQPGRTVLLPHGTYAITGTVYTRNADVLRGDGYTGSQVILFRTDGECARPHMGANASAGPNTYTMDSGGSVLGVEGIAWAAPESALSVCVDTGGYSGFEIARNWFLGCGLGVLVRANIGTIHDNVYDSSTHEWNSHYGQHGQGRLQ